MATLGRAVVRYKDYDGESSTVPLRSTVLTAANFDAQVAAFVALQDAIAAITLGLKNATSLNLVNEITTAPATDPFAQREMKWLVSYTDVTTQETYKHEVPCPDLNFLDANDRAHADIGDAAEVDAFISAFEAFVLSPDGNAVSIDEITLVGRNL